MEGMTDFDMPTLPLIDGYDLPQLGLGVYKLDPGETERVVRAAIELGYRHIDTASFYDNEEGVGRAINDAIKAGDVTREELFITTKLWNSDQGNVFEAYQSSLSKLDLEFIDLYMIHWPWPERGLFVESFEQMARLQGMGQLQSLGVANFYEEVLDELIEKSGITPVVNQIELHVGFTQDELRKYHDSKKIVTEAWAPLARGTMLNNPDVKAIAAKYEKTSAQVLLRFLLQLGISVIPKTGSVERLEENLGALSFRLSRDDMQVLASVQGERLSNDPREFPGPVTSL
ncbi:aldo/keto reductase [Corynebacterium breve]|uniref:Aldo/keto reductase n=1 Tax=Corynebacterium breve TaxID=3049799 RepID=A0ABY8VH56_9CORY|nr:aldo/keto reductase [Corynebacterium breve]WIM68996.1 aldo/keto reductase [Corynebacterium breve]